jgi:hypothetical protein
MSTLTPSDAGRPQHWDVVIQERDDQPSRQAAFIPRSALLNGLPTGRVSNINSANSLLDTQGYSNVNIDIPLNTQSSLHMELTHDGKVTELVARFESYYTGYSDASEESHDDDTHASSIAADHPNEPEAGTVRRPPNEPEAGTVRRPPNEHIELEPTAHTVGHAGQSPRKQLPAQWMPKSSAPKLATAQRAKERTHKKGSESGSPIETRTLRGTRSSVELGKMHGREGATYLTKEALAAVETSVTSPTSPLSPSRTHGSPSKRLWNSPTGSPLRSSTRQHPTFSIKMSPTKSTHLHADSVSAAHSRTSSSVANSFRTAEGSPVRSPASTEASFQSAAENSDTDVPSFDLYADSYDKQVLPGSGSPRASTMKAKTEGKASSMKPNLAFKTPMADAGSNNSQNSTATLTSATSDGDTYMSNSPWSPDPSVRESRIPRIGGVTSKIAVPAQNATLKRAQSVKNLATKVKILQNMHAEPHEIALPGTPAHEVPLPETPAPGARPHVRTLNSSGATPIISRASHTECSHHGPDDTFEPTPDDERQVHAHVGSAKRIADTSATERHIDVLVADLVPEQIDTLGLEALQLGRTPDAIPLPLSGRNSRVASNATVRATQDPSDPVLMDPSIIYSRKKSGAFGTVLARPLITVPTIIVMVTHTLPIGTLHLNTDQDTAATNQSSDAANNGSPVRGRRDWYVPNVRRQADSEHSTRSSMGSDLRADAPAFVPSVATNAEPTTTPTNPAPEGTTLVSLASLQDRPGLPDVAMLDPDGLPFLWYMFQAQFAYEQGFRNGRLRSPKKFKPKKQRSSVSSPADAQPQPFNRAVPIVGPNSTSPHSIAAKQRMTSAELMPPPPLPVNRRQHQEDNLRENSHPSMQNQPETPEATNQPFSSQLNFIAEQAALRNRTNTHHNPPRHFNVGIDLTTVRNVGLPSGPRNMMPHGPTYYTVPRHRRHPNNGLYSGRGNAVGIPMDATAPFPNPVPPQGRLDHGQIQGGVQDSFGGHTIGKEACGTVNLAVATELMSGAACNACAPDH